MAFSAVLLAGGESRRMGRDKATLDFHGKPLWQRQLETLRQLTPDELFVSARTRPAWLAADMKLVLDGTSSRGPMSGVAAALVQTQTSHLLVLAVDMPLMTGMHLSYLLSFVSSECGVLPLINQRAEPLAAIYPSAALPFFTAALSSDELAMQPLVAKLVAAGRMRTIDIPDHDRAFYRNLNRPEDLRIFRANSQQENPQHHE